MKAFCWTRAGAAAKGNKAAVFSSSSSETTQKICRGIWAKGCSRAFAFQFLFCVLPISISFSITLGRIFQSWLKQCARTRFCFCGLLSLTAVDLLHSFLRALIFSPPACHVNLFPRGLLGTCQAWGDRIRELNTPGCASVTGGRKAANQHAFIFLQNNEELSLWLSVSLSAFLVSLFVPWSGSSQNRSPGVGKWDVWGCWKALGSPAVMEL